MCMYIIYIYIYIYIYLYICVTREQIILNASFIEKNSEAGV